MEIFRSLVVKWHCYAPIAGHYAPQSTGPKPIANCFGGFDDFTKSYLVEGATAIFKAKKSYV